MCPASNCTVLTERWLKERIPQHCFGHQTLTQLLQASFSVMQCNTYMYVVHTIYNTDWYVSIPLLPFSPSPLHPPSLSSTFYAILFSHPSLQRHTYG